MHFPDTLDFLLHQVCHLHHHRVRQVFESLGLYRGQPPILRILWDEEGLTHNELALRLHVTPATMSRTLQRMEKAGFLMRKPDPADQRVSRVYLTGHGRAVQEQVQQALQRIEADTFAGFTAEELTILRGYLERIRGNLWRATEEKDPC
ncbi:MULTISPECIES: MarR family winged helix-turn-helix transcriptional regulator [Anaerolinea]|uniref:MarR family winged helix-turn-helix transcriptional regulator n=1 Tax=Anaerolinea TaxID=233189 RepID=UPI00260F05CF|nr:MarR family transcriptional regulator [Anaerolinea thermophila]